MLSAGKKPVFAVTSFGMWAIRHDLARLLDAEIRFWPACFPLIPDGFVGWGRRPSFLRAARLGRMFNRPVVTVEDGFLKSYAPGARDPAHSYIMDTSGIFFDAAEPGDLAGLIDRPVPEDGAARVASAMAFIRQNRLSKYNNAPQRSAAEAGLPSDRPYVLLVDQVPGDASLAGALAGKDSFAKMLVHARDHYPEARIVARTHPAAGENSLLGTAARALGIEISIPDRMNPWPLLEGADAVYTVSSQLGFEALMAEKPVHCFGVTYYSHRGLTLDHIEAPTPRAPASLAQIFHAAYIDYARYLDLHDRSAISLERALSQMLVVRDQRNQVTRRVYTGGLSPWKRKALDPFIEGPQGRAVHCRTLPAAVTLARQNAGQVALWGSSRMLPADVPSVRFEDGFIRSRGLGANLAWPSSLAMDGDHVYYDARGESRLEQLISSHLFPEPLLVRARSLVADIVEKGVSKYNVGSDVVFPETHPDRLKILVPGQVEKDASIRFGSPVTRTNLDLTRSVRRLYPEAFIAYKEHPDVTSGLRSGGETPVDADLVVREGDIKHWIAWCDRVETMTSLTGFEALIRNKPVGVHGIPFYAGWGLTEDRLQISRRQRKISIDMLAAATLILYPFYIHPVSRMPCTPEDLVHEISANRPSNSGPASRLLTWFFQSINRSAVKLRDRRN